MSASDMRDPDGLLAGRMLTDTRVILICEKRDREKLNVGRNLHTLEAKTH